MLYWVIMLKASSYYSLQIFNFKTLFETLYLSTFKIYNKYYSLFIKNSWVTKFLLRKVSLYAISECSWWKMDVPDEIILEFFKGVFRVFIVYTSIYTKSFAVHSVKSSFIFVINLKLKNFNSQMTLFKKANNTAHKSWMLKHVFTCFMYFQNFNYIIFSNSYNNS